MARMEFIAGADDDERRADRVVRCLLQGEPLGSVYAAIRKGIVRVNGKRTRADNRIHAGDKIEIFEKGTLSFCNAPLHEAAGECSAPLQIDTLFSNEHILIVNKHSGQAAHGKGSIAEEVVRLWRSGGVQSLSFRPGPLHRLDRAASGALTFSQSLIGAKWFTQAMKEHRIKKTYLALLEGEVTEEKHWRDFIAPSGKGTQFRTMQVISGDEAKAKGAKEAVTSIFPLLFARAPRPITFARIAIDTGRKHQIRCQCAFHGHPLSGDSAYGGRALTAGQSADKGLFLHCARLSFPDNDLGVPPEANAPLSNEFCAVLDELLPAWRGFDIMGGN